MCERSFNRRANLETEIRVVSPGYPRFEYFYAPFFYAAPNSWGPLDLVPLPLENFTCAEEVRQDTEKPEANATHLNLVWNVALASVSPAMNALTEPMIPFKSGTPFDLTVTDYDKAVEQVFFEKMQRLVGYKFSERRHTGRVMILDAIGGTAVFVHRCLFQHYWITRMSTTGISIIGARFLAASHGLHFLMTALLNREDKLDNTDASISVMDHTTHLVLFFAICKTLHRVLLERRMPFVKTRPPSRIERASLRLEAGAGSVTFFGIVAAVLVLCFVTPLREYVLIAGVGPKEVIDIPGLHQLLSLNPASLEYFLVAACSLAGVLHQMLLNYRAKTFAGQYRWGAWLGLCTVITEWLYSVPWVVGVVDFRGPVSIFTMVSFLCVCGTGFQAVLYRSPNQETRERSDD